MAELTVWSFDKNISSPLKFIYSEKATKFCKISTLNLTTVHKVKSKVEILHNFVAFSEYMNFKGHHKFFLKFPDLYCLLLIQWYSANVKLKSGALKTDLFLVLQASIQVEGINRASPLQTQNFAYKMFSFFQRKLWTTQWSQNDLKTQLNLF